MPDKRDQAEKEEAEPLKRHLNKTGTVRLACHYLSFSINRLN